MLKTQRPPMPLLLRLRLHLQTPLLRLPMLLPHLPKLRLHQQKLPPPLLKPLLRNPLPALLPLQTQVATGGPPLR